MTKLVCTRCDGSQVEWRGSVLVECSVCLGRGWQSMPAAMLEPRNLIVGIAGFVLGVLAVIGATLV